MPRFTRGALVSWRTRGARMTRCTRGARRAWRTSWPRIASETRSSYSGLDIVGLKLGRIVLASRA